MPPKRRPSEKRSSVESRNAPNRDTFLLFLAMLPSRISQMPPVVSKIPAMRPLKGINKAAPVVMMNPVIVIILGLILKLLEILFKGLSRICPNLSLNN